MIEFLLTNPTMLGALIVGFALGSCAYHLWGVKQIHIKPSHRAMFEMLVKARIKTMSEKQVRRGIDREIEALARRTVAESEE